MTRLAERDSGYVNSAKNSFLVKNDSFSYLVAEQTVVGSVYHHADFLTSTKPASTVVTLIHEE